MAMALQRAARLLGAPLAPRTLPSSLQLGRAYAAEPAAATEVAADGTVTQVPH